MSSVVGSANKANLLGEDNETLYDPYPWFTLNSFCEIPWPGKSVLLINSLQKKDVCRIDLNSEWSDAELNAEAWDEGKGGKMATAAPKSNTAISYGVFEDPHPPELPSEISKYVFSWKRPQELFQDAILTVCDSSNVDFELYVPDSIAPKCDFFTAFNEQLPILQFYASTYGFPVELETPNFVANTQREIWRPWHHIYAMCKAGKGQIHKPLFCPFGKYVVRLFYMGVWRRFVVDDKIPCDVEGNSLLPLTQTEGELWPIILMKAMLKILSLTPAQNFFAADFSFISALTGWSHGSFTAVNKSSDQIWRRLVALMPRYELTEKDLDAEDKTVVPPTRNPTVKKDSSKKEPERIFERGESQTEKFCFIFAHLKGVSFEENSVRRDYTVGVTVVRDCPMVRATKREGTKPWKRIRWVYWAKEKGLWVDENLLPPYRRLLIITFFQELSKLLTPDPKLEAVMYDIPNENDSDLEEELSTVGEKLYAPEQWCDFNEFLKYLSRISTFFKPSFFGFNFKITCLKNKTLETALSGKSAPKVTAPLNLMVFPYIIKDTCNEPLLVLVESLSEIFLCVSLWVHPQKAKTSLGYLKIDQPEVLKIGHASLVIERSDWRSLEQGEIISLVKTVGYSVTGLSLRPGRHILKFWICSDSPYMVDIYSNVNIFARKSYKIRSLMSTECQRILNYINNVSNAFITLSLRFGKPNLSSALQEFYNAIKPGHDGAIGYCRKVDEFIETFINYVLLRLKDSASNVDELILMMGALRSLFINPDIRCDLPIRDSTSFHGETSKKITKKIVPAVNGRTLSEILNYPWTPEEIDKIIMVQRIFRGYRVRLLWKYQTPARKEFKLYTEKLKKISDILFIPANRELEVGTLLRRIVMTKPDLLITFKFYEDFANVVQVEEFTGKIPSVEPYAWVPIARFIIACHSEKSLPCAFHLSCNLEQFVIQGFNNDTGEEIFRKTNCVSPHYYHSNVKGYTIFVFGWNEANPKTVNWRLEMVKMKYFQVIHLCNILMNTVCHPYSMPSIEVFDLKNFYVPNTKFRICRCLIKIQRRTLLTLRFVTSYPNARFKVIISLDPRFCAMGSESDFFDNVVATINSSSGAVMLPSLVLEYVDNIWGGESYSDSNSNTYIIEVILLDNSWPLTKQEWGLVELLRVNGESWKDSLVSLQSKKGGSESRKRSTRNSKKSINEQKAVENPFWLLQVLNDSTGSEAGESIVVEEDKSYAESVKAMKILWEEKDPGRRKRGSELRKNFLFMIYLEERRQREDSSNGEYYGEKTPVGSEKYEEFYDDPQILLDRLSSFSYLTNDISPDRYNYSPRILPTTPLCELLNKYSKLPEDVNDNPALLELIASDTQSYCSLPYQAEKSSRMSGDGVEKIEESRKEFLRDCLHYRFVMAKHMSEEQRISNQLMEEAYAGRLNAIERMLR